MVQLTDSAALDAVLSAAQAALRRTATRALFCLPAQGPLREQLLCLPSALVLSDQRHDRFALHRYRDYLGQSQPRVVLDCSSQWHADALAALAGTVTAGGLLLVLRPTLDSPFQQRVERLLQGDVRLQWLSTQAQLPTVLNTLVQSHWPAQAIPDCPSLAQQQVVQAMLAAPQQRHVIIADRGRGKSSCLGMAIAQFGQPVLVTASKRSQVDSLLQRAGDGATFVAWQQLLRQPSRQLPLVIDEAASLPLHVLQTLCQNFPVWAFATTVEGYEGCGKGFVIRFLSWLASHGDYQQHLLTEPLRWTADDALEPWLERLLCLRPMDAVAPTLAAPTPADWRATHASSLDDWQLNQVMQLLLHAHYQSSPNDLRLLLDDSAHQLLLYGGPEQLQAVLWWVAEGPVAPELHQAIVAGTRRPPGALLPQALAYQRQQSDWLQLACARIVRIAVTPEQRRQGIASSLISRLCEQLTAQSIGLLGSSFAAAPELLQFWQQNGFQVVHQGAKRHSASGQFNHMVIRPLDEATTAKVQAWLGAD